MESGVVGGGGCRSTNSIHPTCGSDVRKGVKISAMIDSILSGFSIFCAIAVLSNIFGGIKDAEASVFPVGCLILYIILMGLQMYLAFRLYRGAHERAVLRLQMWKKSFTAVMGLTTFVVFLIHHTATATSSVGYSPYPFLWFYVVYFIAVVFRAYMLWIVYVFVSEFEL